MYIRGMLVHGSNVFSNLSPQQEDNIEELRSMTSRWSWWDYRLFLRGGRDEPGRSLSKRLSPDSRLQWLETQIVRWDTKVPELWFVGPHQIVVSLYRKARWESQWQAVDDKATFHWGEQVTRMRQNWPFPPNQERAIYWRKLGWSDNNPIPPSIGPNTIQSNTAKYCLQYNTKSSRCLTFSIMFVLLMYLLLNIYSFFVPS